MLKRVVQLGDQVELACPVDGDDVYFEWIKDGVPIDSDSGDRGEHRRRRVTSHGSLKIRHVQPEDEGDFICLAVSAFGRRQVHTNLVVWWQPDHDGSVGNSESDGEWKERRVCVLVQRQRSCFSVSEDVVCARETREWT